VDKPAGPTSHDVVARVRRLFGQKAVGHTGTLDPFATGLLVLVLGGATRLARWAGQHRKLYRAELRLGVTTSTDDPTGTVLSEVEPEAWPDAGTVRNALAGLCGPQRQRPPAFSAKRVAGVRSHRLARRGGTPELAESDVLVYGLALESYAPPVLTLTADVGPGTYIRALARDLGERLGCGAHVTALRRERIGPWEVGGAVPFGALTGREALLPPRELVAELPGVELAEEEVTRVGHGRDVLRAGPTAGEAVLLHRDRLVAVARAVPEGWHPAVVLP
jgi:tRNA pseudouridine55 synthase